MYLEHLSQSLLQNNRHNDVFYAVRTLSPSLIFLGDKISSSILK